MRMIVTDDALALIAAHGDVMAYAEARGRAREERKTQPRGGHWEAVRKEVARITGRTVPLDTATRMERDSSCSTIDIGG